MNRDEQLHKLMSDYMRDIILENIPPEVSEHLDLTDIHITELNIDDDGEYVYGEYRIDVDNGRLIIDVEASALYKSFEDKWNATAESHYTVDVESDELENLDWHVTAITEVNVENRIDEEIERQIDEAKRN